MTVEALGKNIVSNGWHMIKKNRGIVNDNIKLSHMKH